jgi:peptidoglycan/xylan/chitin deacetylase (PgdA/CDA1 family)
MSQEIRILSDLRWPGDLRLPVALTFELQSGEGSPQLPGGRPNFMVSGTLEYGARTGVWNILETLAENSTAATFFICGATAQKYAPAVRAIAEAGHEIAGMSFAFDRVRTLSPDRERDIVRRTSRTLEDSAGCKITGWRCPDYRVSPQTLDVLSEEGFGWDSSLLNDDHPSLFRCSGGTLVEIPFTTSTADKTFIGYPYPQRGGPDGLADAWSSEFEVLATESERASRYMILSIQTWATGRPAPLRTLRQFIEGVSRDKRAKFVRCCDIAEWSRQTV